MGGVLSSVWRFVRSAWWSLRRMPSPQDASDDGVGGVEQRHDHADPKEGWLKDITGEREGSTAEGLNAQADEVDGGRLAGEADSDPPALHGGEHVLPGREQADQTSIGETRARGAGATASGGTGCS